MSVLRFWDGSKWVDLSTGTPYPVQALTAQPVLDVGIAGQIRAGRQLTAQDFTGMGLNAPRGLWNLSDLTDVSGNGRTLNNKGAVPFAPGINGQAATAAQFAGSTGQALYIADSGAADPFRITTGSWGCWFRTANRTITPQSLLLKYGITGGAGFIVRIGAAKLIEVFANDGADHSLLGVTDVADDRWHFVVATHDGTTTRIYLDGVLEASANMAGAMVGNAAPLNIGAMGTDGGITGTNPHYGRVDEAFVTADVLSEDQVRMLYCAKLPHTLGVAPKGVDLSVRRRRRGGTLAVADFPTQPLRLHNFTGPTNWTLDEGSNGVTLTNPGTLPAMGGCAGADGIVDKAILLRGGDHYMATDAGLPSGTAARSYGCWFKCGTLGASSAILGWGTATNVNTATLTVASSSGQIMSGSGGDSLPGPFVMDGQWHFVAVSEDNAAGDGVKRKMYLDGRLVAGSTVLNAIALGGANKFRVGALPEGTAPFTGQIDGVFVCGYALTFEQIAALYAKGSQDLGASPKNAGDHVERVDSASLLVVFDTLETQHTVDVGVAS